MKIRGNTVGTPLSIEKIKEEVKGEKPLVVIIDDYNWAADYSALEILSYMQEVPVICFFNGGYREDVMTLCGVRDEVDDAMESHYYATFKTAADAHGVWKEYTIDDNKNVTVKEMSLSSAAETIDAVRYTEQTLTPEQKAQARANIGASKIGASAGSEASAQEISFTEGKVIFANGKEYDAGAWYLSNEIPVLYGMTACIKTKLHGSAAIVFFDRNGAVVLGVDNPTGESTGSIGEYELDVPQNAACMKFSCYTGYTDEAVVVLKDMVNAIAELDRTVGGFEKAIVGNTADIEALKESLPFGNLVDDTVPLESGYIADANGKKMTSTSFWCTDYIPLKTNTTYYVKGLWCNNLYGFYDKDKNHIAKDTIVIIRTSETNINVGYFTTNDDAVFIRMSSTKQDITGAYIYTEDKYVPYGYDFSNFVPAIEKRLAVVEQQVGALVGKKVLVLGDSISDNTYRTPNTAAWDKWASVLSASLGFDLTNDSIHATGFIADNTTTDKSKNLVNRITAHTAADAYDLVVIFMGVNEHIQGNPLGDSDSTDKDAYVIPAMKYCLDYLTNTFPAARICALLPLPYIGQGTTLVNYVDAMRDVYYEYSVPVLDLFNEGGFRPKNQAFREQFTMLASGGSGEMVHDGVHPNQEWDNNYLAPRIKNFLTSLF